MNIGRLKDPRLVSQIEVESIYSILTAGEGSMARGFTVEERSDLPVKGVWDYLVCWNRASKWMGVQDHSPASSEPIGEGTRLTFKARGAERESIIETWNPSEMLVLTSVQGSIRAVYRYQLQSEGQTTIISLNAQCEAKGLLWCALHSVIEYLMKRPLPPA